jgi:hypothetical protein
MAAERRGLELLGLTSPADRLTLPLVAGLASLTGFLVYANSQIALILVLTAIGCTALGQPASRWLAAALAATLTFKWLGTIGVLPTTATYADMFFAWGALTSALLRRQTSPREAKRPLLLLILLSLSMAVSAAFNNTEPLRPVVYLILLGTPFVAATALLIDPPTPRDRRLLERTFLVLLIVQIPLALRQAASAGANADVVQGTLIGAGAGAHVISAIVVLGAFWVLYDEARPRLVRLAVALPLLVIPFLADAKQVILAAPAALLVGNWRGIRDVIFRIAAVAAAVTVLLALLPAGRTAASFLANAQESQGGKEAASRTVLNTITSEPSTLVVGLGPAESVSRAAFMTTPLLLGEESPLHVLGLEPASLPATVTTDAEGTSFDTGLSSALGVLGDIGLLGSLAYALLLLSFFLALRRSRSPATVPATAGLAMFVVLGLVFDWWEQPPFTVTVGVLLGLALTDSHGERTRKETNTTPSFANPRNSRRGDDNVLPRTTK